VSTALYRRYRPESFAEVIGQEHVTQPLMQALRTGRVHHAYLFSGPRGCGKTTSARILARCLNCERGPTPEPCGVCDSCVALARGGSGSVDVIEIDAASHGGVDDARDLRERASYGPAQSRYKIYIIDEAHMVTPQGFNALLKIVEEPPEHVKFVFATTEPEKVIGTIRSRTHHYPFRLVPPAKLADYMERLCVQEGVAVAPGVLGFVTRAGGGSVRDSLSVLDQLIAGSGSAGLTYDGAAALLGFTDGELLDAAIDAFAAGDGAAVFAQVDRVIESGHDPRRFVEDLLERLRDLIIIAAVPDGASSVLRGVPEDQLDRMRGQQARFGPGALSRAADIVNTGLTEMTGATAPRLQLELICARILLPAASGEGGYAARLERLERRLDLVGTPSTGVARAQPHRSTGHQAASARPTAEVPSSHKPAPSSTARSAPESASSPPVVGPTAAGGPRETTASVPAGSSAPSDGSASSDPSASSGSGGIDTAAIRRVWPDVLGRIFRMRRATWTFVSQHVQVLEYDGTKLVLGIGTVGLANTFRQGNHAELVRQALIDEIGVDVPVEGVSTPDAEPHAGAATPAMGDRPTDEPEPEPPPLDPPTPAGQRTAAGAGLSKAAVAPDINGGWGSTATPAPESATGMPAQTTPSSAAEPVAQVEPGPAANGNEHVASVRRELARARRVAAESGSSRGGRGAGEASAGSLDKRPDRAVDDAGVSADDEDIVESGSVGRGVIEKVLGGRLLGELDE
jgi:DNA polymerase-3 subunit gamma/tau